MFERAAFRPISFGQPPDKYFRVARRSDPENKDSGTQVTCRILRKVNLGKTSAALLLGAMTAGILVETGQMVS